MTALFVLCMLCMLPVDNVRQYNEVKQAPLVPQSVPGVEVVLSSPEDEASFDLRPFGEGSYTIRTTTPNVDLVMQLHGADGEIARDDDSGGLLMPAIRRRLKPGHYEVRLKAFSNVARNSFPLRAKLVCIQN